MDAVLAQLLRQQESVGRMLRRTMDSLSEEEFARAPGDSSPPVGWHLWHIARWSDRFQATLADRDEPSEIWLAERLPEAFGLEPDALGVLELGMSMDAKDAQLLPRAMGKAALRCLSGPSARRPAHADQRD